MLRVGRFRHRLLDDNFLKTHGTLASQCLQHFLPLWQGRRINDVEMAAIYILIFAFLRRPKDFLGGVHNQNLALTNSHGGLTAQQVFERLHKELPESLRHAKSLTRLNHSENFLSFFTSLSLRSIPFSVTKSLAAWSSGKYPLKLLTHIPSPEEVLMMQCEGRRCISMLIEKEQIENFVEEGRDVLGFIVHDLIHADHFFSDPHKAQAQIHFCRRLHTVYANPEISSMLNADPDFAREFEYLMSDMNSVPLHLLKTLKATLLGFYKRKSGLKMNMPLSHDSEDHFKTQFASILKPWDFSSEALEAAQRLNTPLYQGQKDSELLHWALVRNISDEPTFVC